MSKDEFVRPSNTSASVYWITGLSGAGKSTVADVVTARLRAAGRPVLLLDGDVLRTIFPLADGHAPEDRIRLALAYGRLCREVAGQGIDVVCATISMFHEVRRWNRAHIPNYREIYLRVPLDERRRRDPKGLYAAAERGEVSNMVGLDAAAELPQNADLVIDNFGDLTPFDAGDRIWALLVAPAGSAESPAPPQAS